MKAIKRKVRKAYGGYTKRWPNLLRSKTVNVHHFLEKPAMRRLVPSLAGKTVLAAGCGSGEEIGMLKLKKARRIVGFDLTPGLIEAAKQLHPDVLLSVMDIENIKLPASSFDFVYSSLVFHYLSDWEKALKGIYKVLKPGGTLLFSTHHPVKWGAEITKSDSVTKSILGYERYEKSARIYGDYLNVYKKEDIWFKNLRVSFYHLPFSKILKNIRNSNFEIEDFIEPKPVPAARTKAPAFWAIHQKIPVFMIFKLRKPQ